jgi:hypothetical protein
MRRYFPTRSIAVAALVGIAACAHPQTQPPVPLSAEALAEATKQKQIVFRIQQTEIARLQAIGDKLRIGAAPLCDNLIPRFGWATVNGFTYSPAIREIAISEYSLGSHLKVIRIMDEGPASQAGIMVGDEIAGVDDTAIEGADAPRRFEELAQAAARRGGTVKFDMLRGGQPFGVELMGLPACNYPVGLIASEKINAGTDGRRIGVSEGLVRFARDDSELALVIAHEMSHDIRKHVEAQRQNARTGSVIGGLLDILAAAGGVYGSTFSSAGARMGAGAYSTEFEAEADYVSLYVMALSGFDITNAPDFWRRMAGVRPDDIDKGYTHPTTAERFVALEAVVGEIRKKQAEGVILRPELRKGEG